MNSKTIRLAVVSVVATAIGFVIGPSPAEAQRGKKADRQIAWYGVLQDGLAEAERTGKPIFLTSAAPQCVGVSGMW